MKQLRTVEQVRRYMASNVGKRVGLVPTMGFLHAGHESLIRACVEENDVGIVSIFVNPTQFAPGEDLQTYPRSEERDKNVCEAIGCDAVFIPELGEVYGNDFGTWVECDVGKADRNSRSEGAFRPTFFRGVATMVTKLMCLIRPDQVYFGQKDAQQVAVVKRLMDDLWLGSIIRVCETVREADGLAMSSRNAYMTGEERKVAGALWRGMQAGKAVAECSKEAYVEAHQIRETVMRHVEGEWQAMKDARVLYVSVCDPSTFREVSLVLPLVGATDRRHVLLCVAAKLGNTRLIDNILI